MLELGPRVLIYITDALISSHAVLGVLIRRGLQAEIRYIYWTFVILPFQTQELMSIAGTVCVTLLIEGEVGVTIETVWVCVKFTIDCEICLHKTYVCKRDGNK